MILETPISIKVNMQVNPKEKKSFEVVIVAETKDFAFRERMENLDSNLYFEETSLLPFFIKRQIFKFRFMDIVAISKTRNASSKRTFSHFQIFEGLLKFQFEDEQYAKSFASEAEEFLLDHYKKEYEKYRILNQKRG